MILGADTLAWQVLTEILLYPFGITAQPSLTYQCKLCVADLPQTLFFRCTMYQSFE